MDRYVFVISVFDIRRVWFKKRCGLKFIVEEVVGVIGVFYVLCVGKFLY